MSTETVRRRGGFLDQPYLMLLLTVSFSGLAVVAGKAAVGNIDPFALVILRWIGAVIIILPFAWRHLRADWPAIRARWWLYLFYGAIGYASFNILVYIAAYYTLGVNNALDQVSINIFVMLGNFALFGTRVKAVQLLGVALTIAGVALTVTHGDLGRILALEVNLGDALVLLACLGYAAYSILLRYRPATNLNSFLLANFAAALIASLFFSLAFGGGLDKFAAAIPAITPLGWLIVVFFVLFASVVSQFLFARSVELIGANRASLFLNLIPLFGALGSVVLLGERLELFHFIAGGLIMAGIVLANGASGGAKSWPARTAPASARAAGSPHKPRHPVPASGTVPRAGA